MSTIVGSVQVGHQRFYKVSSFIVVVLFRLLFFSFAFSGLVLEFWILGCSHIITCPFLFIFLTSFLCLQVCLTPSYCTVFCVDKTNKNGLIIYLIHENTLTIFSSSAFHFALRRSCWFKTYWKHRELAIFSSSTTINLFTELGVFGGYIKHHTITLIGDVREDQQFSSIENQRRIDKINIGLCDCCDYYSTSFLR